MRRALPLFFSALALFLPARPADAATLAEHGRTDYAIVLPADAPEPVATAANELRDTLKQITGADFPVVRDPGRAGPVILLGQSARAKELLGGLDFAALKTDAIILKTVGDTLVLSGDRHVGTLYAVYEFLEHLGVRRWTHRDAEIPNRPTLELPVLDVHYAPPFIWRDRLGGAGGVYGAWLRLNGHFLGIPASHGGVKKIIGWCHTFTKMMPPKEYAKTHPEYFALWNGTRAQWDPLLGEPQYCLANPDVRRILREKTFEWLRANPGAEAISVSQSDSWGAQRDNYCHCETCAALDAAEGSPAASILSLVNEIAEAVEKEFPNVLVETLAYHYSDGLATMRPRDNVVIRYCTSNDFVHPWNSEENAKGRDSFLFWRAKAKNLWVWNYTANFRNFLKPRPGRKNFAADTRFMAENGVTGVLQQSYGRGLTGDLMPLDTYVLAKLLWNPDLDADALTDEFLRGYYGAAAPSIRAYMDASWDLFARENIPLGGSNYRDDPLPVKDLLAFKDIFDRAEGAVADDPARLLRVKTAALAVDLPILYSDDAAIENAETPAGKALRARLDPAKLADDAMATYKALDVKESYREDPTATVDKYIDAARKRVTGDWGAVPEICKNLAPGTWRQILPKDMHNWGGELVEDAGGQPALLLAAPPNDFPIQWNFRAAEQMAGTWKVYVEARAEGSQAPELGAFLVGGLPGGQRQVKVKEVVGPEYVFIDCGTHTLPDAGRIVFGFFNKKQKTWLRKIIFIKAE